AALLLVLLAPLMAVVAIAVLVDVGDEGVLFRQRRVGRHGGDFVMLKFRTMTGDPALVGEADLPWAADTAGADLPAVVIDRRTRVGNFLRRFRLDELPQLVNVVRGEMSLVGPRPERPCYVDLFADAVPGYCYRTRMKPGITGLAQVRGLVGETSLDARVQEDNQYIDDWHLGLDLTILLRTLPAVVAGARQVDTSRSATADSEARGPRKEHRPAAS
ncbi:MAG: sugar transferase, partial [Acidimicrobiia bacterium]|nr:sugar transferase [Acidimicrobiia bacterium]